MVSQLLLKCWPFQSNFIMHLNLRLSLSLTHIDTQTDYIPYVLAKTVPQILHQLSQTLNFRMNVFFHSGQSAVINQVLSIFFINLHSLPPYFKPQNRNTLKYRLHVVSFQQYSFSFLSPVEKRGVLLCKSWQTQFNCLVP